MSVEAAAALTIDARFLLLAGLATALETRKVVFLSRRPGWSSAPDCPSVVSLATDTERLLAPGALSRGQALLLRQVKLLLEKVPHSMGVTVVNPLQFLRELFTINGAGTLIRRGSRIDVHDGWQSVDPARLRALFASAFGRDIRDDFFTRPIARTFVEELTGALPSSPRPRWRPISPSSLSSARPRATVSAARSGRWSRATTRRFSGARARRTQSPPGTSSSATVSCASPSGTSSGAASPVGAIEPAVRHALTADSDFG